MINKMIDKKKLIINFLKRKERISTTEISVIIKSNYWMAEQYLNQLEEEGKIKREIFGSRTYWSLK